MTRELIIKNLIALICRAADFKDEGEFFSIEVMADEFHIYEQDKTSTFYEVKDFMDLNNAMHKVVDYLWYHEEKNYEESEPENKKHHIFNALKTLRAATHPAELVSSEKQNKHVEVDNTVLWKQSDGTKIRVCDMNNSHLTNTIKMLYRAAVRLHNSETMACASITFLGEQAQMAQDDFLLNSSYKDYLPAIYNNLINESKRRGLHISVPH